MKGYLVKAFILFCVLVILPASFRFLGLPYLYDKVFYNEARRDVANIQNLLSFPGFLKLEKMNLL